MPFPLPYPAGLIQYSRGLGCGVLGLDLCALRQREGCTSTREPPNINIPPIFLKCAWPSAGNWRHCSWPCSSMIQEENREFRNHRGGSSGAMLARLPARWAGVKRLASMTASLSGLWEGETGLPSPWRWMCVIETPSVMHEATAQVPWVP